ncbi:DUF4165 domain-containing protein [Vibrio cholerae]|uniref:DUF4165 domain-containing protein n=1 Tax=Vibrio cholerae TaxID=666 RepID=UPI0030FF03E9
MINFKPKIPAMLGALAVLTAGAAHAELLEYTFKAPDGTQRSLTPNANYANPTGNISFALSARYRPKGKDFGDSVGWNSGFDSDQPPSWGY